MSDGSSVLAEHCRQVAESATSAIQWLAGLRFRAPEQRQVMEQELRHVAWRADILRRNITRPADIALFGPNQSGKSYLAAALSRRGVGAPRILLGDEKLDYLTTTNSSSPARSSACVTRFSLRRSPGLPAGGATGLPGGLVVPARLLSQADVIRIIANAYLEDIDPTALDPISADELAALLDAVRAKAGAQPGAGVRPGLTGEDVQDIRHYFDQNYAEHPVMRAIGNDFWAMAASLAPRLSGAQRAALFAPFWGSIPQLGNLATRLLDALEVLGNPGVAFAEKAALAAGANSITEVETMMQGLEDDNAPRLRIGTTEGYAGDIARPVLAALTAEIHLTLETAPHNFFQDADLLDFPGALPRNRFTDPESLLADPTNRAWLFRRGKAAYLFQRYSSEQELTSLVLCLEDGPPTARSLPGLVKEWIDLSHGASPEERAKLPCGLFVVLTKFDLELKDQLAQREDDPEHWTQRVRGAFNDFLCREHRWSDNWVPSRPFTNIFWMRQIAFVDQDLMQYDASGRETGVADRARMTRLRSRFLTSTPATRHFGDASRAWDEAMRLNDGGVSHLATQLRAVCDPDIRRRQVAESLAGLARDLHQILEPFNAASDPAAAVPVAEQSATARAPAAVMGAAMATDAATSMLENAPLPAPPADETGDAIGVSGMPEGPEWSAAMPPPPPPPPSGPGTPAPPPGHDAGAMPAAVALATFEDPPEPLAPAISAAPPSLPVPEPAAGMSPQTASGGSGKLIAVGVVAVVGIVIALSMGMFSAKQPPAPTASAPITTAPSAPAGPLASAPTDTPTPLAASPAPPQAAAATTAATQAMPPAAPQCGAIEAPERLSALPADVTLAAGDLVCVAKRWIAVGRPGDAVLLLTRALQSSPQRAYGPASIELARLYDPLQPTPNWPSNTAYAMEKYQDAMKDTAFPEIQQQAKAALENLQKAQ